MALVFVKMHSVVSPLIFMLTIIITTGMREVAAPPRPTHVLPSERHPYSVAEPLPGVYRAPETPCNHHVTTM